VTARSVAGTVGGAPVCLMSLEPSANQAISVSDSAIDAPGCLVQVNSSSSGALEVKGTGSITAEVICVVGGVTAGGSYSPEPETNCGPMSDPLAGRALPTYSGCDSGPLQIDGGSATLSPGVYCGTLEGKNGADITLDPGIYVLQNGLKLSGGASITGVGVGIFLTGTGNVDLSAGGSVNLSAPTYGEMAGLVFFQDPGMPAGTDHKLSGGSNVGFEGTLYFPTHDIEFSGSSGGASPAPYTMAIARQYKFTGGSSFGFNSNIYASSVPVPAGLSGSGGGGAIVLVE